MFLFAVFSLIAIVAAVGVIVSRRPIYSALFLLTNFASLAALYIMLQAQFLAAVQVIVYAGAIVTLILFVIMLLNLEEELRSGLTLLYSKVLGGILAVCFLFGIIYSVAATPLTGKMGEIAPGNVSNHVKTVGGTLFTRYLFPFEIVSVLLVVSIVGAVVLSKKKK